MLIGNRFLRIIVMTFGWVVLALLLLHWIMPQYTLTWAGYEGNVRPDNFKGFGWFFNQMGKFPGIQPTIDGMTEWVKALKFAPGTDAETFWLMSGIEFIVNVMKYIATPFILIGLVVYNIALVFIWLLGFLAFI